MALLLASCHHGGPGRAYDRHLARWQAAGLRAYAFTFVIGGMGGAHAGRVTVRNGRVVDVAAVRASSSSLAFEPLSFEPRRPTIDDVWALLRHDLETADKVEVSYDADYGFPSEVQVDREKHAIDDEYGYQVRDFALAPRRQ